MHTYMSTQETDPISALKFLFTLVYLPEDYRVRPTTSLNCDRTTQRAHGMSMVKGHVAYREAVRFARCPSMVCARQRAGAARGEHRDYFMAI
jgi:hypothetical protein